MRLEGDVREDRVCWERGVRSMFGRMWWAGRLLGGCLRAIVTWSWQLEPKQCLLRLLANISVQPYVLQSDLCDTKDVFLKRSCSLRYFANSKYGFSCAQLCCSWAKRSASTDRTCSRSYIQRSMVMPLLWPLENHSSSRDLASSTTLCCLVYDMTSISSPLPVLSVFGQWNHSLSTVLDHSFQ